MRITNDARPSSEAEDWSAFAIWCCELELTGEPRLRSVFPAAPHFRSARVLVRLHGEPLGYLKADVPPSGLDAGTLREQGWSRFAPRIRDHLAADGVLAPDGAAALAAISVDGCHLAIKETPTVSVVVCTRNRVEALQRCLRSLMALDYPDLEIAIVDNAPSDARTQTAVETASRADERVRYLIEPRPGLARARNRGLHAVGGRYIAFTDDDVIVDPGWIHGIVRGFQRQDSVGCVTGLLATANIDSAAEAYFDARSSSWSTRLQPELFDLRENRRSDALYPYNSGVFGAGANFAFDRAALIDLGGFDEGLGAGARPRGGEDLDIFVRVILGGYTLAYEPSALIWHSHRADDRALLKQMFGYGSGTTALATKLLTDSATRWPVARALPIALYRSMRIKTATTERLGTDVPAPPGALRREFAGLAAGPFLYALTRFEQKRAG